MRNQIRIQLDEEHVNPGATIAGKAGWELEDSPRSASVRLFWKTSGKGTEDIVIVDEVEVPNPSSQQLFDFSFQLPVEPYSFHGRLVSIAWGIEAVVGKHSDAVKLVMAPDGVVVSV